MTAWDLLAAAWRAWLVVVVGALLTCFLVWHSTSAQPVYSAEVRVTLVAKDGARSLRYPLPGLILTAELVSSRIASGQGARPDSDSVSLVGEGVRQGYSVTLPNSGSQWVQLVNSPDLRVQAVGSTPAEVRGSLQTALTRIDDELDAVQAAVDIAPQARIRASVATPAPEVMEGRGNRPRAALGSGVLGAALTTAVVRVVDGRRTRRRAARTLRPS